MRTLVTGGSGLVGTEMARICVREGHEVFSAFNEHEPKFGRPLRLDLRRFDEVDAAIIKIHPELIVHTAAISDVDLCERNSELANLVNGEATGRIARTAGKVGSKLVYLSTDYVFDGSTGNYDEKSEPRPINKYGESKLLGERLTKDAGGNWCIARTSVVYGWWRSHVPNFATWVVMKLESGKHVQVSSGHSCSPTFAGNLVDMILEVATKDVRGIIHLSGATRTTRYDFAVRLAEIAGLDARCISAASTKDLAWVASRPKDSSLNVTRAMQELDARPMPLLEALKSFLASRAK